MKKLIILLFAIGISTVEMFGQTLDRPAVMVGNTNKFGKYYYSLVTISNGWLRPVGVIGGIHDLTGSSWIGGTNTIPSIFVVGTNVGPAVAGTVIRANGSGLVDSTLLPVSTSTSSNIWFRTNLVADFALTASQWTNVFTYRTTLGSNATANVIIAGGIDSTVGVMAYVLTDGNTNYPCATSSANNTFLNGQYQQLMVSNTLITVGFRTESGGINLKKNPVFVTTPLPNATAMSVLERK